MNTLGPISFPPKQMLAGTLPVSVQRASTSRATLKKSSASIFSDGLCIGGTLIGTQKSSHKNCVWQMSLFAQYSGCADKNTELFGRRKIISIETLVVVFRCKRRQLQHFIGVQPRDSRWTVCRVKLSVSRQLHVGQRDNPLEEGIEVVL